VEQPGAQEVPRRTLCRWWLPCGGGYCPYWGAAAAGAALGAAAAGASYYYNQPITANSAATIPIRRATSLTSKASK